MRSGLEEAVRGTDSLGKTETVTVLFHPQNVPGTPPPPRLLGHLKTWTTESFKGDGKVPIHGNSWKRRKHAIFLSTAGIFGPSNSHVCREEGRHKFGGLAIPKHVVCHDERPPFPKTNTLANVILALEFGSALAR
jgi:hypothetical protein